MLEKILKIMNMTADEIMQHPRLMVCAFDTQHRVIFWNKFCEQLIGVREKDVLGKKLTDLVPGLRNNKKWAYLEKVLSGQSLYLPAEKFDLKAGTYDHIYLPLKDDDGNVVGALSIIVDLLDRSLIRGIHSTVSFPFKTGSKPSSN